MTRDRYLRQVRLSLGDLPWKQRRNLIAELQQHLAELPPDADLVERLGQPMQYALDLRAAAGLELRRGPIAFLRARRPRNLILVVVALAAIVLSIGTALYVAHYQPLAVALDSSESFPPGSVPEPTGDGASVVFHTGRPFRLGITIQNTGSFTVRVLGVPAGAGPFRARLRMSGPKALNAAWKSGYVPFHPFDLPPGQEVWLELHGVFTNCHNRPPGTSASPGFNPLFVSFPVRYSFLWKTKIAEIPLPQRLAIVLPKECQ